MSEKAVGSQCLGDQSPFKYRVRKTYSVFEHLLYKLRTFGSKYVNRTVIHSIYCTNYVLPENRSPTPVLIFAVCHGGKVYYVESVNQSLIYCMY